MEEKGSGSMALELIAGKLKKARIERNLSLDEASQLVSVQRDYLAKIENGDFSFLPNVYILAHIKAYSRALGVGSDAIFKQCSEELQMSRSVRNSVVGTVEEESKGLTVASAMMRVIVIVFVIAMVALGTFFAFGKGEWPSFISSFFSSPSHNVLVVRVMRDYSWVKVVADDGVKIYAGGKLSKGQEIRYESRTSFNINIDRPECVELYLNGKKIPPFTDHFIILK